MIARLSSLFPSLPSGIDNALKAHFDSFREKVTSPNDITAAALKAFEDGGLENLVKEAVHAARKRDEELSKGYKIKPVLIIR